MDGNAPASLFVGGNVVGYFCGEYKKCTGFLISNNFSEEERATEGVLFVTFSNSCEKEYLSILWRILTMRRAQLVGVSFLIRFGEKDWSIFSGNQPQTE